MSGGSIQGNHGGVNVSSLDDCSFTVSGKVNISGNGDATTKNMNVYLFDSTAKIRIGGKLDADSRIGVRIENETTQAAFTSGLVTNGTTANFFSDDSGYVIQTEGSGDGMELKLVGATTVTFAPGDENASGYMPEQRVETGSTFKLPDCGYTLEDYAFKEWSVQIGEAAPVSENPGNTIIVTADTTVTAEWKALEPVAYPAIDPDPTGETYISPQSVRVTLSCATAGAEIWYTTDGSEPTNAFVDPATLPEGTTIPVSSSKKYAGAITVTESTTIRARAYKAGMAKSGIVEAAYTFVEPVYTLEVTAPVFDPVRIGYAQPAAQPLAITSIGNTDTTIQSVALSGDQASSFELNKTGGATIGAGATGETTYTIRPAGGLGLGTYTATVTVTYVNGATETAQVSFTVECLVPCEVKINVKKVLAGRDWNTNDEFKFTLREVGTAPVPSNTSVSVTSESKDRTVAFEVIPITQPGTYSWVVYEPQGENHIADIIYDVLDKTVTVKVVNDGNGYLVAAADSSLAPTVTFTNRYNKPASAVTKAPEGKELKYSGRAQELVTAGEAENGEMRYVLGEDATDSPVDGWSADIPTGTEVGTYYVWYKVAAATGYSDTVPVCIEVTIASNTAPYTPGKPAQNAPTDLAVVDATSAEAADGMITGATDQMEFSADDGKTWTKVPEGATEITGLAPGDYLVRFAETPDYNASEAVKLSVGDKSVGASPTYDALSEEEKKEADAIAAAHNTDKETAAQMLKYAMEHGISLDTVKLSDAAIKGLPTSDEDPAGSSFGKLTARATKRAKTAITVTWKQLDDADGYLIYGNLCNKSNKLLKTLTQKDTTKWTQKKLKKRKFYKYMVVAYKNFSDVKMPIAASVYVHTATKGAKKTVAKSVKVNKTSVTLAIGETVKLKASEVKAEKKKLSKHRAIRYEVENLIIATVAEDGTITAVGEGSTTIYAYAQNGLYRIVTVTVTVAPPAAPNSAEEINAADALTIEPTEPETDETLVEIDDGVVEDNDTAQIEAEIIPEDDASYID